MSDQFPHKKEENKDESYELELLQQIDPDYMKKLRKKQERKKAREKSKALKEMLNNLEEALI